MRKIGVTMSVEYGLIGMGFAAVVVLAIGAWVAAREP